MKRFLIHVSTYWCGMDNTFRAEAESELELDEIADQLAYDNFQSYGCEADIAEEEGYDPDEMEDSDWDKLWETVDESQSCDLYGKHPFDRTKVVPMGWLGNTWSIDNSPELDGYTFYIDTPICQFRVPELSRRELVDIQEQIEYHFEKFIPNYLKKLIDTPTCDYGEVIPKNRYNDWEVKK